MRFMLSCEEVRFQAGADPRHLSLGQRFHMLMCSACRGYVQAVRRLDRRIEVTLRSVAREPGASGVGPTPRRGGDADGVSPETERSRD